MADGRPAARATASPSRARIRRTERGSFAPGIKRGGPTRSQPLAYGREGSGTCGEARERLAGARGAFPAATPVNGREIIASEQVSLPNAPTRLREK